MINLYMQWWILTRVPMMLQTMWDIHHLAAKKEDAPTGPLLVGCAAALGVSAVLYGLPLIGEVIMLKVLSQEPEK